MHPLIADSGPQNSPWIPDSPSFLDHVRPFSSYFGSILVTMEATEAEQHGAHSDGCECVLPHHGANVEFPKVRV